MDLKYQTGTTIVALKKKNFLILGGDRKVTTGNRIEGESLKIMKVGENVYLLTAGVVGHCQLIFRILKRELKKIEREEIEGNYFLDEILILLQNILTSNNLYVGLILAGRKKNGDLGIFSVDPYGGSLDCEKTSIGSGSSYALGILDRNFKDIEKIKKGEETVLEALKAAAGRDIASGLGIDIYTLETTEKNFIKFTEKNFKI